MRCVEKVTCLRVTRENCRTLSCYSTTTETDIHLSEKHGTYVVQPWFMEIASGSIRGDRYLCHCVAIFSREYEANARRNYSNFIPRDPQTV